MTTQERPPTESPPIGSDRVPSLVLVHTGHGKGKSTAAFGTMLRAVSRGWKVAVVQFLKSGNWKVGEEKVGRSLGVDWWALGDGFTWDSDNMSETEAVAREAWSFTRRLIAEGTHRMVVLDEVTYPLNWGWIDESEMVEVLRSRPPHVTVILTGRDAPDSLIEAADTVTEMVKVKHAFDRGIRARRGIDY
ncbi:MAG: cob(I)yrinic acid a,c-diamide adenosyltransferase [Actinomycetia bacterium]|nr:cob(I)yrinic acid a,c-diamide adenosyltransferase [Actinomycetes bacterium]